MQGPNNSFLNRVYVLVFIYDNVLDALCEPVTNLGRVVFQIWVVHQNS